MTVILRNQFDDRVESATGSALRAKTIDTIQVNIGLTCDLACHHCHVESSPKRDEQMDWATMVLVLSAAERAGAKTIDITGGAPEMNPHFRRLVSKARDVGHTVMVRTNLTIMTHQGYEDMPEFYRDHEVHLVASLPCYTSENVAKQRGLRAYDASITIIKKLNSLGYGASDALKLDLVYNPIGPTLPPDQSELEQEYRRELDERFGIKFTRLITITNMPIGRFAHDLRREGKDELYMQVLNDSFNPETVDGLMCRSQVHVSWDGLLHDCDFNYALGVGVGSGGRDAGTEGQRHEGVMQASPPDIPAHIRDFDAAMLIRRRISTGAHCFGCTAGHGSSCGGALT